MRYFFLAYALIAILVVSIGGFRGDKSTKTPIEIFNDMDRQDKIKSQKTTDFFHDGMGSRKPVEGTQPQSNDVARAHAVEFGGQEGYYATGAIDEFYGNGLPEELALDEDNILAFLNRGHERYSIYCSRCHGKSGDGHGVVTKYEGMPTSANLRSEPFFQNKYPDGRLYHVINHGKGQMSGYGYNLTLRDRWAIVAYVRALQLSVKAPLSDPAIKSAFEAKTAEAK